MAARELIIENFDFSKRHRLLINYKETGVLISNQSLAFEIDMVTPMDTDGGGFQNYDYSTYIMGITHANYNGESWYIDNTVVNVYFTRVSATSARLYIAYNDEGEIATNDVEIIYESFDTQLDYDGYITGGGGAG